MKTKQQKQSCTPNTFWTLLHQEEIRQHAFSFRLQKDLNSEVVIHIAAHSRFSREPMVHTQDSQGSHVNIQWKFSTDPQYLCMVRSLLCRKPHRLAASSFGCLILGHFYCQCTVSILSASYSLEKNSDSGGGVTNFRDQAQICTGLVHVISRLVNWLVDLYLD